MNIYLSSSWKNRDRVRALAICLREEGYDIFDFTDPTCKQAPEIPPERFPEQFDPEIHTYCKYLKAIPEWRQSVECNREAIHRCDTIVLMLPCGNDAHADAYYGLGLGKRLIVCGQPHAGDRSPVHMWADLIVDFDDHVPNALLLLENTIITKKLIRATVAMCPKCGGKSEYHHRGHARGGYTCIKCSYWDAVPCWGYYTDKAAGGEVGGTNESTDNK